MVLRLNQEQRSHHTERRDETGLPAEFLEQMAKVIAALKANGYEPYDQLTGYVRTRNERYITRQGGAREIVLKMEIQDIKVFLKLCKDRL